MSVPLIPPFALVLHLLAASKLRGTGLFGTSIVHGQQRFSQRRVIQLQQRRITIAGAVPLLGLSERHVKRLLAAYWVRGPAALVHGNRGRRPRHALSDALKARVRTLANAGMPASTIPI